MSYMLDLLLANREIIELALVVVFMMSSQVKGVIAVVSEMLQAANSADNEVALNKAVALLKKRFPFLPDILLRALIQWVFDSLKKESNKEVAAVKAWSLKNS